MSIPFEGLDVQLNTKIELNLNKIYDKIVVNERGGICYELNYLFYWLLTEIGFKTQMVSSRIYDNGTFGPPYDHMSLIVHLDDLWLVDVGYGDLFIEPLLIHPDKVQEDYFKNYKITPVDNGELMVTESLKTTTVFKKKYVFDLNPRAIHEFTDQCHYKQYSPDSFFVKNLICTLPTSQGRKTLFNNGLKIKNNQEVNQRRIEHPTDLISVLKEEFGIYLSAAIVQRVY